MHKWMAEIVLDEEISDPVPVIWLGARGDSSRPSHVPPLQQWHQPKYQFKIRLFADDCVLYRDINSNLYCSELQQDVEKIVMWCHTWQMFPNINKCHTLHAHRKKQPIKHKKRFILNKLRHNQFYMFISTRFALLLLQDTVINTGWCTI